MCSSEDSILGIMGMMAESSASLAMELLTITGGC